MASCNSSSNTNDFRGLPSVLDTAGPSTLGRAVDLLAGPLALVAAGLTFFAAYELTVAQPVDLLADVEPALTHAVAAPVAAPAQAHGRSAGEDPARVSAQAIPKTISMIAGATSQGY